MTKNKCFNCNKKLKILSFSCYCQNTFCQKCKMPEEHQCTFDFKTKGKKQLEKVMPKIETDKIIKI